MNQNAKPVKATPSRFHEGHLRPSRLREKQFQLTLPRHTVMVHFPKETTLMESLAEADNGMRIFLSEITDQQSEFQFTQEDNWVKEAVVRVDEAEPPTRDPLRTIQVDLGLRKVDEVIVITGHVDTFLRLLCSRCGNTFHYGCSPQFTSLFCNDPVMAGIAHLPSSDTDSRVKGKPVGQSQGFARHAHDFESDQASDEGKDIDIAYLSNDYIELGDILTEQLQLQVPFRPLCQESCKGVCFQCGTDLNLGRCACSKLKTLNPFSKLKDLKL